MNDQHLSRRRLIGVLGSATVGATVSGVLGLVNGPAAGAQPRTPASSGDLVVDTTAGPVRGVREGGVTVFRGVPYAASPTGGLRFKPPVPPVRWHAVRDATRFGPAVPQEELSPGFPLTSEASCLTVNIWTPGTRGGNRPVLVWALDGAHQLGFPQMVDGHTLAHTHDVVVVSVGIRVGALGYTWLNDGLGDEYATSGNLGTLDHALALEWVRDNIERFGGDPRRVTAFGISGSAGSAMAVLTLPSARGLIRRAILQSADQTLYRTTDEAGFTTTALMRALGLGKGTYRQILTMPIGQLIQGQATVVHTPRPLDQATWFGPVVGPVLPEHPIDAFRHGAARDVEVITGSVRDEFTHQIATAPSVSVMTEPEVRDLFEAVFPGAGDDAVTAYQSFYRTREWPVLVGALFGDRQFGFGGVRIAKARHQASTSTWIYHFVWPSPQAGPYGVRHGIDWPFTFDTLATGGGPIPIGTNPPQRLADTMTAAWTTFAATGRPGNGWPRYRPDTAPAMILDADPHVDRHDPLAELRRLWERTRSGIDLNRQPVWPSV